MTDRTIRCASIEIPTLAAASPTSWVQIARTGDFQGYGPGAFSFTPQVFADLVRNVRQHPAFKLGADGYGAADVVPWDIGHATEVTPTNAPAQGWVQDLDIRPGPTGVELWAKTRWLDSMRNAINAGAYRWASVVVLFDARDPETNKNVGALLTSVAVTNVPFIEGMAPLVAASRQAGGTRVAASAGRRTVRIKPPFGVSPNSPGFRALARDLYRQVNATAAGGAPDDAPATPEEQALAEATRAQLRGGRDAGVPPKLDATACAGRNAVERAITCMRAQVPGFGRLGWDEQLSRAADALRVGAVVA